MKIWHFCPSPVDPAIEQGGVANVVRALALESAAAGIETTVVCGDHELGRKKQETGTVVVSPYLSVRTVAQRANPALGPVTELREIVDGMPAGSVAHVHTCFSAFSDRTMRHLARRDIPFVFSPHGKLGATMLKNRAWPKRLWWRLVSRKAVAGASRIGLFAQNEASELRRLGIDVPCVSVPNGYRLPVEEDWRKDAPLVDGRYVLYLGYLDPRKQPDLLIRAFARTKARESARLVLVGPDSYGFAAALRQEAAAQGVAERVLFYGPAYGLDKWNLLANALCLCLPSRAEGMPLVLAEAVGASTPSLFSRECNAAAIALAGAGLELAENTAEAWAEAIDAVVGDGARAAAMRAAASQLRSDFSWPAIAARWIAVYRTVLEGTEHRAEAKQSPDMRLRISAARN